MGRHKSDVPEYFVVIKNSLSVDNPFLNRRVTAHGKLGSMTLHQAAALVRKLGGKWLPAADLTADLILLGADGYSPDSSLHSDCEQLTETELWQRLGWLDHCEAEDSPTASPRLYTPAMLAEWAEVPVLAIRRWQRAGLLIAAVVVHRLPYFDFGEIAVAKQIALLMSSGTSFAEFQRRLAAFASMFPELERPLAQLTFQLEGKRWLVRVGEQWRAANGQQHFDFIAADSSQPSDNEPTSVLPFPTLSKLPEAPTVAQIIAYAEECEAAGDAVQAAEYFRTALQAGGPQADLCFQLAECLFRMGDLAAARERYLQAIEYDPQHVEAYLNLGCVLAELNAPDLAIAALQGALRLHADYADAHLHLAQLFDQQQRSVEAEWHWQQFARCSQADPWRELAEQRLRPTVE
jgi:tetratricopeptide (TPR) repeat protein